MIRDNEPVRLLSATLRLHPLLCAKICTGYIIWIMMCRPIFYFFYRARPIVYRDKNATRKHKILCTPWRCQLPPFVVKVFIWRWNRALQYTQTQTENSPYTLFSQFLGLFLRRPQNTKQDRNTLYLFIFFTFMWLHWMCK